MNNFSAYTHKAELYDRYRWHYAPQAVNVILEYSRVGEASRTVDLGAGTGILTRDLIGKAGFVVAIEPDLGMRRMAARKIPAESSCEVVAACAEATGLRRAFAALVCVAQAIHWFQPDAARREILRILKPGGWLAILSNYSQETAFQQAVNAFHTPEYGVQRTAVPAGSGTPVPFYFGAGSYKRLNFEFITRQTRDGFIGALLTTSYAPEAGHPQFDAFIQAAHAVFDRFSTHGEVETRSGTELYLGQPMME